jgi:tRNA-splicing ligase RtcB (3'-phosphate/5'-hydroxy nucleic acid ligase)
MDLSKLMLIDEWSWTVPLAPGESRGEVRLYGSRELLATMDDKAIEQIVNVARLPGLVGPAMTMADAHWGYGFPIGGVAACDPEEGGIRSASRAEAEGRRITGHQSPVTRQRFECHGRRS